MKKFKEDREERKVGVTKETVEELTRKRERDVLRKIQKVCRRVERSAIPKHLRPQRIVFSTGCLTPVSEEVSRLDDLNMTVKSSNVSKGKIEKSAYPKEFKEESTKSKIK